MSRQHKQLNKWQGRQALNLIVTNQSIDKWREWVSKAAKLHFNLIHPEQFAFFKGRFEHQQAVMGNPNAPLNGHEQAILCQAVCCALKDNPPMTIWCRETDATRTPPAAITVMSLDGKMDVMHWSMTLCVCLDASFWPKISFDIGRGTMAVEDMDTLNAFDAITKKFKDFETKAAELRAASLPPDVLSAVAYDKDFVPDEQTDFMTVDEFKAHVRAGVFVDDDGCGYPVKNGKISASNVRPSDLKTIPSDATHIAWFGK